MERTILVADDDQAIASVLVELLKDEGYRVRSVADGHAALREIERAPPDLLVSDIRMPHVDGVMLTTQLRARGLQIPVVLLSAVVSDVQAPGVTLIRKPFDVDDVLRVIRESFIEPTL